MSTNKTVELSVVIPMRNEGPMVGALFARLIAVLNATGKAYEIVCVNDGSDDDTQARLLAQQQQFPSVRILELSRGFGKEAALTAGIDHACGSAVVVMDADLQDPPELIPDLIAKWQDGYEVVYGARRSRDHDSWLKRTTAKAFYALFNKLSDTKLPPDAGDFRLMDRAVVEALTTLPEHSRFMKGIFAWVGFKQIGVPYDRPERQAGESQWPYFKLFRFALDGLFSFSTVPLRLWTWIGIATALIALSYALFLVVRVWVYGIDVPGYASLMVAILFFGGVQLISVGVLGEYIGRIFRETKGRPLYIVKRAYGVDEKANR
ncbi:glycosyltransferase family 2 protein [Magnetovibrio sp.]|uniref:glycosyltransferase family 2 protein n=1 Tax=Magnetovibrio sp. TaxID=2024836 RepID=UPI002F9290C6